MSSVKLPIADLAERHFGLTQSVAACYEEAARVCLDRHHTSPVEFAIKGETEEVDADTEWVPADRRTRSAWANEIDATEAGAYCFALAAVELSCGLVAVRRAETRTGADYYLAPVDQPPADLEATLRLEASGVDHGNAAAVEQRLRTKLEQAAAGNSNLPAMAGVVGFRARLVRIRRLEP